MTKHASLIPTFMDTTLWPEEFREVYSKYRNGLCEGMVVAVDCDKQLIIYDKMPNEIQLTSDRLIFTHVVFDGDLEFYSNDPPGPDLSLEDEDKLVECLQSLSVPVNMRVKAFGGSKIHLESFTGPVVIYNTLPEYRLFLDTYYSCFEDMEDAIYERYPLAYAKNSDHEIYDRFSSKDTMKKIIKYKYLR